MKIVLATEQDIAPVKDRYLVLELDTFSIQQNIVPSWCVIDAGDIPLSEMTELDHYKKQHENLIKNYKKGNLGFVEQMLEHLKGKFGGNVDSFYTELFARLQQPKSNPWDYVITKEAKMYHGKGHIFNNQFNKVSDFMERYYRAPTDSGPRPTAHYRPELRRMARLAYRIAKKTVKELRERQAIK